MDSDESFVTSEEGVLRLKKGTGGKYKGAGWSGGCWFQAVESKQHSIKAHSTQHSLKITHQRPNTHEHTPLLNTTQVCAPVICSTICSAWCLNWGRE